MPVAFEPAAVAVTLTVVPSATGNLRAFAFSGPVPLASVLNYYTGANIANTTIVPACQGCGSDLTLQIDGGTTHIIADVVGYFRPNIATPTDVLVVNSLNVVPNGDQFAIFATCPPGWRVTGGGHVTQFYGDRLISGDRPAVAGQFGFDSAVGFNLADSWLCQGLNDTGFSNEVRCYVVCSRVPGI
jgi:hypothetical protein